MRRAIAIAAARLMAEDGLTDYAAAKRKAARSLGAENGEGLPTNEEVQIELRAYQLIYQEDEQNDRLQALRQTALRAMQLLNEFQPRLTGAVLDGTAARYSPIHLQLVADSSKDVEIWLLTNQITFDTEPLLHQNPRGPEDRFVLDIDDTLVLVDVFSGQRRHGAAPSAAMSEVKTLLANSPTAEPQPMAPSDYGVV
ncbi:hypothetical protein [Rugosibacter aromaticivorans]|uniref:hypothetical protein n=1 Tax=Rugosibacter aromaticivorans TaxID=1565605 RepID=UPI00192A3ADD|nr:hypothetical protein [Rugosibacter aromaticivorans]